MKWTLINPNPTDNSVIVDENGKEVLGVSEWVRADEKDLELMAAAPELLEALSTLVNRIEKNWDAITSGGQNGIITALLEESKQAIEKATK